MIKPDLENPIFDTLIKALNSNNREMEIFNNRVNEIIQVNTMIIEFITEKLEELEKIE